MFIFKCQRKHQIPNLASSSHTSVVGHQSLITLILATWEAEIGSITVSGQPRQKVHKALSQQKKLSVVVRTSCTSDCGKRKWENCSLGWSRQKVRPYLQNNQSKKEWRNGSNGRAAVKSA
jgi:hypothetical protein